MTKKNYQSKNLFVCYPIYSVTIDAHAIEKLTRNTACTRNKIALTLKGKLFPGVVLTKSTVAASMQSKTAAALDKKLMASKSKLIKHLILIVSLFFRT